MSIKNKIVLAIAAHPDDLEFSSAGTVAKFVKAGAAVYYLIVTDGSKGSENHQMAAEELVKLRQDEQNQAAKILGVKEVFYLNFVDGELENSLDVRREIVRVIRHLKPDTVITLDPTFVYNEKTGFINHPDHRSTGQAALDAIFPFARNNRTFPELLEHGLESHHVKTLFLVNLQRAGHHIDISDTFEKKLEALSKHASQFKSWEDVKKRVTKRAEMIGKKIGKKYAEAFVKIEINS